MVGGVALTAFVAACSIPFGGGGASSSSASSTLTSTNTATVTVSSCPPDAPPTKPKGELPPGNVALTLRTQPPVSAGTEATVRFEGDADRSTVRIDATQLADFALSRGVYLMRITVPGYRAENARVRLTAGCSAVMTVTLTK